MKSYLAALPKESKSTGHTLNVIADKDLEYKVLFDVIRAFRVAGFESLLFITQDAGTH